MRRLRRRSGRERDLERELEAHLDLEAAERRGEGLGEREARHAARRALGNLARIGEDTRAMWPLAGLERAREDFRYALRAARKNPGFTAIAALTLALGIGANTAVFSVIDAVLLRQPPYFEPDRLTALHEKFPKQSELELGVCPAEYLDYRDRTRAFSSVAGYENVVFDLTGASGPVNAPAERVTANLFSALGAAPFAGRTFTAAEDHAGSGNVMVLSYEFWQRHFGGNRQAIGWVARLNENPYRVIGIMPPGFQFPFTPASVNE